MNQSTLEALLGRSLTAREITNKPLYLEIAKENLKELICVDLDCGNTVETRTFVSRDGYSTVFCDVFNQVDEVKVDGVVVTNYYSSFFDDRNAGFYNSLVFDERFNESTVEVKAVWGFNQIPKDLQRLWAQMFAIVSKKRATGSVKSKQVEDFRITFGDLSDEEQFEKDNRITITKYNMCGLNYGTHHGTVCETHRIFDCGHCIR